MLKGPDWLVFIICAYLACVFIAIRRTGDTQSQTGVRLVGFFCCSAQTHTHLHLKKGHFSDAALDQSLLIYMSLKYENK